MVYWEASLSTLLNSEYARWGNGGEKKKDNYYGKILMWVEFENSEIMSFEQKGIRGA